MSEAAAKVRQRALLMLVTAVSSLALTLGAWLAERDRTRVEARARFEQSAAEIVTAIQGRLLDYEQVLRGGIGLHAASHRVDREEWAAYVRTIALERAYPGIQGLGYAPYVGADALAELENEARGSGIPGYRVFPPGPRRAYVPVFYLEPRDPRNLRAFGFDMYSERERRIAMDRARDENAAVITGPVTLVQEDGADVQVGFLMYLPVYRPGAAAGSVAERRAALQGFVYAAFRARDLMVGILGAVPGLAFRLRDVTEEGSPKELYVSPGGAERLRGLPAFSRTSLFTVERRNWQLEAASLPAMEVEIAEGGPRIVLASGIAISALLLLIVWTLNTTRERARDMARHMTGALRASEERLQMALRSSRLALFDWDVAAGLVQLSAEWQAMLGGERGPTLAPIQKLQLLVHPEDRAAVEQKVRALLEGEIDDYRVEHRVRQQDGSWLWIESVAQANERGPDRRALRVTGANMDIEERKAVERLKSEFIATVSHELRTPLTSMLGSLGLLREGSVALGDDARRFVDIAYANSERLAELVDDILDMERIEAGRLELRIGEVALGELLARAIDLHEGYAQRHQAAYVLAGGAAELRVRADPERLMQVLANLLSNAAKHSPAGGEVTIAAAATDGRVRITVTDNGPGIPPEFRARLFDKFEQADRERGGTGLGLAISKALVERMQGRIGCDSEPGRGSSFWVELPKA